MKFIADFHIHSKYSRATSQDMDIEHLSEVAKQKGIKLLGTGDFTHHAWFKELKEKLQPLDNGLFKHQDTYYILTTEVNNIFYHEGRSRRIHNIIFASSFEVVDLINRSLTRYGKLEADGRPTLSLSATQLAEIIFSISSDCLIIPGHIWTPWFSLYGANSGFDRIEDCFNDQLYNIYALETGLSSDPQMNWRLSALDNYTLISNSDAHSPSKIGREANVFDCELSYYTITEVIRTKDKDKFLFTIEFFPEEGKYHYDGHRKCNTRISPVEARLNNDRCPNCGSKLTIGVMHRLEKLADRPHGFVPTNAIPYRNLIPLEEIISAALQVGTGTAAVESEYRKLLSKLGTEFDILMDVPEEELNKVALSRVVQGILRVREGKIKVLPGYDGVYGTINIFNEEQEEQPSSAQLSLF